MRENNNGPLHLLLNKLDEIRDEITELKIITAKQEENLKIHMKRSDNLEEYMKHLEARVAPIEKHVTVLEGIAKIFGFIAIAVSIVAGVVETIKFLF